MRKRGICLTASLPQNCGRDCFGCNQGGEHKNICRISNVLYNWECNKNECDAGYYGQSSKNNFTRSGQHRSLYNNWARHEDGSINPRSGKGYAKPQSSSFLYDHQIEDHNGAPPEFKLQSKRYYGRNRLACQVAEGVSIKMRTGKILNSKTDWDAPSLITLERNIRRGLWLLWLQATTKFLTYCGVISSLRLLINFVLIFNLYFAVPRSNLNLVMFEKARCAKHVTQIINFSK